MRNQNPPLNRKQLVDCIDIFHSAIRSFFNHNGYREVVTPVQISAPAPEDHIEPEAAGHLFLRTSPELQMKQLLADGCPKIFQLGSCFRKDEKGPLHHPEYTMLEWYHSEWTYLDLIQETRFLVLHTATALSDSGYSSSSPVASAPWPEYTVSELYQKLAGWDPVHTFDDDRFDMDMVEIIEPHLADKGAVIVKDYPVERAAFSAIRHDDPPVAERWELYINGLEIANAYTELTNPAEQLQRMENTNKRREALGHPSLQIDERFLRALSSMPECAGIALGVDRLLMALLEIEHIDDVLLFPEEQASAGSRSRPH